MTDAIRKAAQSVVLHWKVARFGLGERIEALELALAAPAQAAPHARDAVAWTPDTGYVFADAKNAQAAPDDAKAGARWRFMKTLPRHKVDRIVYSEPDSWDMVIDNMMEVKDDIQKTR